MNTIPLPNESHEAGQRNGHEWALRTPSRNLTVAVEDGLTAQDWCFAYGFAHLPTGAEHPPDVDGRAYAEGFFEAIFEVAFSRSTP